MSDPTADQINSFATFCTSAIFSGIVTFLLAFPSDCSGFLSGGLPHEPPRHAGNDRGGGGRRRDGHGLRDRLRRLGHRLADQRAPQQRLGRDRLAALCSLGALRPHGAERVDHDRVELRRRRSGAAR